jgi:RNA polymerase sigma factor (sigma-70 family)
MATAAVELPSLARDREFETLYERYAKDVYHYALAVLRNPADAEDVTQTTFLNAYRAIQRGEHPLKPQNWLIKIAHNAARTRFQRASRRVKEVPLEDHVEQLVVPEEDKPDVEAVLEALGRLPLNQRAALVMRELEGRTYSEIAETLSVSVPAVETLIFRARRALRLKASSVRVLSVVQLPASLAQLLEGGGGVVAGGSALVGSGFLFKAAIAVVAGVVATSVGGDHTRPARAAPASQAVAAPPWAAGADLGLAENLGGLAQRVGAAAVRSAGPSVSRAVRPDGRTAGGRGADLAPTASSEASARTGSAPASTGSTSQTVAGATAPVTSTVSSVTSSLPVSTPTPAPTPTVPAVTVPQLPAPPPVQVPPLPQPPPPPPLP